ATSPLSLHDALPILCLALGLDMGPADPRDASVPEAHRATRHDAESLDAAVLLTRLERELQAEADAERRLRPRAQNLVETALAERSEEHTSELQSPYD